MWAWTVFLSSSAALGGNHHVLPHVVEGLSQFFLAVGVHIRGVEIVDPRLIGPADQLHRVRLGDPLNGQGAERRLGHQQAGAAQSDFLHDSSSFPRRAGHFPALDCITFFQVCKPQIL